jgi:hypothetical protein
VHFNSDPGRRASLHAALEAGTVPASIAIDDHSAALYEDSALARVLRWGSGLGAYATCTQEGRVVERHLPGEALSSDA